MATPIRITDPEDPRLEPYRAIRERDLVGRQGRFILEGEVVFNVQLQRGRFPLESVLMSERRLVGSYALADAIPSETPLYVAADTVIESLAGFAVHRGLLGIGLKAEAASAEALLLRLPERALVVCAVGIANHDNMGGLFRNAAAFAVDAMLLDQTSCDPLYRKAIRVSVGAALAVPYAVVDNAARMLELLEEQRFSVFGLSPAGALSLSQVTPPARSALVLGAEGPGLPQALLARLKSLRIPIAPDFDSLNVATASGIALSAFFNR